MDLPGKDVAGSALCPGCYSGNPPENRFCGQCGAALGTSARGRELAPRVESRVTPSKRFLPDRLGPVGKTVVVSLAIVAADVGLAWLRSRMEKGERPMLPLDAADRAWREGSGNGPEHLRSYFLREAAFLLGDEKGTRGWFYSELTVKGNTESG